MHGLAGMQISEGETAWSSVIHHAARQSLFASSAPDAHLPRGAV